MRRLKVTITNVSRRRCALLRVWRRLLYRCHDLGLLTYLDQDQNQDEDCEIVSQYIMRPVLFRTPSVQNTDHEIPTIHLLTKIQALQNEQNSQMY